MQVPGIGKYSHEGLFSKGISKRPFASPFPLYAPSPPVFFFLPLVEISLCHPGGVFLSLPHPVAFLIPAVPPKGSSLPMCSPLPVVKHPPPTVFLSILRMSWNQLGMLVLSCLPVFPRPIYLPRFFPRSIFDCIFNVIRQNRREKKRRVRLAEIAFPTKWLR